jgi:hypothetical protein
MVYEELGGDFLESDQQLNKLIVVTGDIPRAQGAIELAIKNYTSKNYKLRSNLIVESRVRLLELLLSVLRFSEGFVEEGKETPPILEFRHVPCFKELEVSHVRLIV